MFAGEVGTVVIYKLDRLCRSLRDGINVLCEWCDKGLRVVSVTQQIDFNGAVGKMLAAVLLGIAEMEQETRRERQASGIAVAEEAGRVSGAEGGHDEGQAGTGLETPRPGVERGRDRQVPGRLAEHDLRLPAKGQGRSWLTASIKGS